MTRLDYPLELMHPMSFGEILYGWIRSSLSSARASILVNELPSLEFDVR